MWWQHGGTRGGRGGEGGIEGYCFLGWERKLVGGGVIGCGSWGVGKGHKLDLEIDLHLLH